jgi:hypothetical protein
VTVALEPSFCPVCKDDRVTVFIRSELHHDLVCRECSDFQLPPYAPHRALPATLPSGPRFLHAWSSPLGRLGEVGSGVVPARTPTQPTTGRRIP